MLQSIQENKPGLGINFGTNIDNAGINIPKANEATFAFTIGKSLDAFFRVQVLENGDILQTATVSNSKTTPATLSYELNLGASLNRASYGQLTEGGPIPLPESRNILLPSADGSVNIVNPALEAQLACVTDQNGTLTRGEWPGHETRDAPLNFSIPSQMELQPQDSVTIRARFRLTPTVEPYHFDASIFGHQNGYTNGELKNQPSPWLHEDSITTYVLRRNVDYILANCTIPVSPSVVCIITDHVALPLGWNRDNYWQLQLLYSTYKHAPALVHPSSISSYTERIHAVATGHLTWAFRTAQRPHGYWHRSYLVTGKPKDAAIFQLDQQCYPLLELCDYTETFPGSASFVRDILELEAIPQLLALLASKRDPDTGLWPTDETPGDDAVEYPFHFSSHVLLWRTLTRLRDLYARVYTAEHETARMLDSLAAELQSAAMHAFLVKRPDTGEEVFAYLTDGKGNHTLYHDANDIPTLYAHPWHFVRDARERLAWHATLAFGMSPDNSQGYCSVGKYPGLGSVHSPGAWVLGYFQELAYATMRRDEGAMKVAWKKVVRAMQWDGTFSEAVDEEGRCSSKAWFSWPGSMLGAEVIGLRVKGLEGVLLGE